MVGPTCDSFDKVSLSVQLPGNLRIGDYLYTENIGAYSIASSTKFNGFDGAKELRIKLTEAENAKEIEGITNDFLKKLE